LGFGAGQLGLSKNPGSKAAISPCPHTCRTIEDCLPYVHVAVLYSLAFSLKVPAPLVSQPLALIAGFVSQL
jgi:hypothetical protein